jgi:hypothetical protein
MDTGSRATVLLPEPNGERAASVRIERAVTSVTASGGDEMRRIGHWGSLLIVTLLLAACSGMTADLGPQNDPPLLVSSEPVSGGGIEPVLVVGENPGGNVTCEEAGAYFETSFEFSSERVNYQGGAFDQPWPTGLSVTTDGTFVSFTSTFGIGAVIVKGAAAANVYHYDPQVTSDSNLAAPINASGGPAGLSNLTFCWNGGDDEEEPEPDPLLVSKTARGVKKPAYDWELVKSVTIDHMTVDQLGDSATFAYTVELFPTDPRPGVLRERQHLSHQPQRRPGHHRVDRR